MLYTSYFIKFCNEWNIKESTVLGYVSALSQYESFHEQSIDSLIDEAIREENMAIPLKKRKIKSRLLDFRSYLIDSNITSSTVTTYFSKIKAFYNHFEIEMPKLPSVKLDKPYDACYMDLPTKKHIAQAVEIASIDVKAVILFMSSSGTGKAETLSLTVNHFIQATSEYHDGKTISEILNHWNQNTILCQHFI